MHDIAVRILDEAMQSTAEQTVKGLAPGVLIHLVSAAIANPAAEIKYITELSGLAANLRTGAAEAEARAAVVQKELADTAEDFERSRREPAMGFHSMERYDTRFELLVKERGAQETERDQKRKEAEEMGSNAQKVERFCSFVRKVHRHREEMLWDLP